MKRGPRAFLSGDLAPGLSATAAFLGMHLILGAGLLWLSVLLALAVYAGVRFLLPTTPPAVEPHDVSIEERVARLGELQAKLMEPDARQRVGAIRSCALSLTDYATKHPEMSVDVLFMARQYLEFSESGISLYLTTVSRARRASRQSLATLIEMLDSVLHRLTRIFEKTQAADDAAVASELRTMTQTLKDLDRVFVSLGEEDTP